MAIVPDKKDDIAASKEAAKRTPRRPGPGLADYLAGEDKDFVRNLTPYLPHEVVGGVIPHIPGSEEEAVWNAASQACGTEKVHFTYSIDEGRLWYLACPSSALASYPDSWCPLAAALPGNSEYWDRETVYLYEQEGLVSALRWDPETGRMQVYLGASRTILPRVQSMDANFVSINAEAADIVPWRNRNLKTEKLSRATVRTLVLTGIVVSVIAAVILILTLMSANLFQRDLATVKHQTGEAVNQLMINAYNAMQSDTIKHMVRIQELLDGLAKLDGTLVRYEVKNGRAEWEALIPPAFVQPVTQRFSVTVDDQNDEKDGRVRIRGTQ